MVSTKESAEKQVPPEMLERVDALRKLLDAAGGGVRIFAAMQQTLKIFEARVTGMAIMEPLKVGAHALIMAPDNATEQQKIDAAVRVFNYVLSAAATGVSEALHDVLKVLAGIRGVSDQFNPMLESHSAHSVALIRAMFCEGPGEKAEVADLLARPGMDSDFELCKAALLELIERCDANLQEQQRKDTNPEIEGAEGKLKEILAAVGVDSMFDLVDGMAQRVREYKEAHEKTSESAQ